MRDDMGSILVMMHCPSNVGYAIGRLEPVFLNVALAAVGGDYGRIHFSYKHLRNGRPTNLPAEFANIAGMDPAATARDQLEEAQRYVRAHNIKTILGFDQPIRRPVYRFLRKGGVNTFISYWGAPMSSLNGPVKRSLKRLQWCLSPHGPDMYVFESRGMADTAVLGAGIPRSRTRVVPLGVDPEHFAPSNRETSYAHDAFGIPTERKVFFYSGHMEERKGIAVLMAAANELAARGVRDWHFLLLGNSAEQAEKYLGMLGDEAKDHVTFGGYRDDVAALHKGCYAGFIASTGWDSLTCSSMEMQASGLPLLVSDIPGLREAVDDGSTGFVFPPNDAIALTNRITRLLKDSELRNEMSTAARQRIVERFSLHRQEAALGAVLEEAVDRWGSR